MGEPEARGNLVAIREPDHGSPSLTSSERGTSMCLASVRSRAAKRRSLGKPIVVREAELSVLVDASQIPRIAPRGSRDTNASRKRQSPVDSAGSLGRRTDRENPRERHKTPVTVAETISGFQEILAGKYDHLPEVAFYMVGNVDEVVAKADRLAAERGE